MGMTQLIIGHKDSPCTNNRGNSTLQLYYKHLLMRHLFLCVIICVMILYSVTYQWREAFFLFSPLVMALCINPFFRLSKPELLYITDNEVMVYSSFFLFHKKRVFKTANASLHVYQLKPKGKVVYVLKEKTGNHCRTESFYVKAQNHMVESSFKDHHIVIKHYESRWSAIAVEDQV